MPNLRQHRVSVLAPLALATCVALAACQSFGGEARALFEPAADATTPLPAWSWRDGVLVSAAPSGTRWSAAEYGDCEVRFDVRASDGLPSLVLRARGEGAFEIAVHAKPSGGWTHVRAVFDGDELDVEIDGERSAFELPGAPARGRIGLSGEGYGELEIAQLTVRGD